MQLRMAHEELTRQHNVEGPSDRSFGLVFAAIFFIVACWPLLHKEPVRWWAACASVAFAGIALVKPALLTWLNRQWLKLGVLLSKVVSPIALGIVFYGVFTPLGIVVRLLGNDPLNLKRDDAASSYWRRRDQPSPTANSLTNQF